MRQTASSPKKYIGRRVGASPARGVETTQSGSATWLIGSDPRACGGFTALNWRLSKAGRRIPLGRTHRLLEGHYMITTAMTLVAALTAGVSDLQSAPTEKPVSVVLVHGAFVDGSGWQAVYDILTKDGYEVLVVQNPTISLEGDVAATERAIAQARGPVILVGHSYGGMVITEAGMHPRVQSLVYIAAFAPDAGESVERLSSQPTPPEEPKAPLLPPQDGYLIVDPSKFPTAFAADVDPRMTHFMAAAQVPWGLRAVQTPISKVAWKTKPAHFMVTTRDAMIPPTAQRTMAKRSGARTVEIGSSHAVMLSRPQDVANFIKEAAARTK
jgi:pimeloyl-ACP methyl ester carboxylesterase